jgi:hypothetical protein
MSRGFDGPEIDDFHGPERDGNRSPESNSRIGWDTVRRLEKPSTMPNSTAFITRSAISVGR